jgi:hypothetical protein
MLNAQCLYPSVIWSIPQGVFRGGILPPLLVSLPSQENATTFPVLPALGCVSHCCVAGAVRSLESWKPYQF